MKIKVMYFGRASEFLLMTSEQLEIQDSIFTLNQMLGSLRNRGDRWAYELDDRHVICTVGHKAAMLSDAIQNGDEIGIYSRKSLFEI